jgi:hypothetical protein
VYQHIRNDTGECFYIGKGKNSRLYSEKGRNKYWKRIVKKANGFKALLLASNLTEQEAFNFEIKMIESAKAINQACANIAKGGKGASGFRHTKNHKEKLKSKMLINNPMFNSAIKEKHKLAIKLAMQNSEVKRKQSQNRIGKKFSATHKENLRKSHLGLNLRGKSNYAIKIKFKNKLFDCILDLADFLNTNPKTVYSRIYRNPKKWGYEVLN